MGNQPLENEDTKFWGPPTTLTSMHFWSGEGQECETSRDPCMSWIQPWMSRSLQPDTWHRPRPSLELGAPGFEWPQGVGVQEPMDWVAPCCYDQTTREDTLVSLWFDDPLV